MSTGGCGLFYPVAWSPRCLGVPKQFWRFMRFARSVIFMIYNKTCSTTLESNVGNLKKLEEFIIYSILIVTGQGSMSTGGCGLFYPVAGPSPFDHMQKLIVTKYSASHLENTSLFNSQWRKNLKNMMECWCFKSNFPHTFTFLWGKSIIHGFLILKKCFDKFT